MRIFLIFLLNLVVIVVIAMLIVGVCEAGPFFNLYFKVVVFKN